MNINGIPGLFGQIAQQRVVEKIGNRIIDKKNTDGDTRLSMKELAGSASAVRQGNLNGNSYLDQQELLSALSRKISDKKIGPTDGVSSVNDLKSALGALQSQSSPANVENLTKYIFAKEDDNGDGLLSRQEMSSRADMFAFVDDNGDGSISLDETRQALHNRTESVNSLKSYAQSLNTTLKDLLVDEFDLSEEEAGTVLALLQKNSLDVQA